MRPPYGIVEQPVEAAPQQPAPVEAPPAQPVGDSPHAESTAPVPPGRDAEPEVAVHPDQAARPGPAIEEAEEPHGLGWLLSMSGLGAVTPEPEPVVPHPTDLVVDAPEAAIDAPISGTAAGTIPDSDAPISGTPVSGAPISSAPISSAPISSAPVSGTPVSAVPTSGAAPQQDWFSPTTETRLVDLRAAETVAEGRPTAPDLTEPQADQTEEPAEAQATEAREPAEAQAARAKQPADLPDQPAETRADPAQPPAEPQALADQEVTATDETGAVIPTVDTEPADAPEPATGPANDADIDPAAAEPSGPEPAQDPAPAQAEPTDAKAADTAEAELVEDAHPAEAERVHTDPPAPFETASPRPVAPRITPAQRPQPPRPPLEPERRRADPEEILAAYPWKVDPVTLRETVDDPEPLEAVRDRLTDKLEYAERDTVRASLLSLRAVTSRVLGDLGRALVDAQEALRHAEATGELRRIALVQARLAHVQQWRGEFAEADRLFEEAHSVELPDRLRAELHVQAGKSAYEQGRLLEACNHFEAALELRRVEDPELVARTGAALDAVMERVREAGWGPYPRSREEILHQSRPPQPALDHDSGWQGYADSDGEVVIPERYAEAQPFHEGVAWVRRPGTAAWELIDETGALVIDSASGYVQAGRFADGLAWVSREPAGGWFAVDWHNRVIVPGGFEDVRPFRHGLALVRRGGWGAVDRHGRVVVQLKYQRFATELTAGGPVEGFTGDGLAVVDSGDRLGVVDRSGQVRVAPVHARLLIHPTAFVVGDRDGHWGALDRDGDPVVEVTRERPGDVVDELARLLPGTRPVL